MHRPGTTTNMLIGLLAAVLIYLGGFVPLYQAGLGTFGALGILPAAGAGWLLGRRAGLGVALLLSVATIALHALAAGGLGLALLAEWPIALVMLAAGAGVGQIRERLDAIRDDVWVLSHERRTRQKALVSTRVMRGMIGVCSSCKKIRDNHGYWNDIESYIQEHSPEAEITHGMCPACMSEQYPGLYDMYIEAEAEAEAGEDADSLAVYLEKLSHHPNLMGHFLWRWLQRKGACGHDLASYLQAGVPQIKQLAQMSCPKAGKYQEDDLELLAATTGVAAEALKDIVLERTPQRS